MPSCLPPCDLDDRLQDVGIGAAAADVAAHAFADLCRRQKRCDGQVGTDQTGNAVPDLLQHRYCRADLSRCAVAALVAVVFDEGCLHGMQPIRVTQAFDSDHFSAFVHHRQRQAGIDAAAIDDDRTGTALTVRTCALMRSDTPVMVGGGVVVCGAAGAAGWALAEPGRLTAVADKAPA